MPVSCSPGFPLPLHLPSLPANARSLFKWAGELQNTIRIVKESLEKVGKMFEHRPAPPPAERIHHESIRNIVLRCHSAVNKLAKEIPKPPTVGHEGTWANIKTLLELKLKSDVVQDLIKKIDQCNQVRPLAGPRAQKQNG